MVKHICSHQVDLKNVTGGHPDSPVIVGYDVEELIRPYHLILFSSSVRRHNIMNFVQSRLRH